MYLQYALTCESRFSHPGGLTHVFQIDVSNPESLDIIDEVLADYTDGPDPTSWASRAIFRPSLAGVAVDTNENIGFYALLYTPNARGTAWMLAQHKAQMGLRFIDEIALWHVPGRRDPHMYIHIAEYTASS
jgi:hypothetical protein